MKLRGLFIASAALGLLAGAPAAMAAHHEGGKVKCSGANACSSKGECAAADGSHGCGGKNSCKGKGWVTMGSEKECTDNGGEVAAASRDTAGGDAEHSN